MVLDMNHVDAHVHQFFLENYLNSRTVVEEHKLLGQPFFIKYNERLVPNKKSDIESSTVDRYQPVMKTSFLVSIAS